MRLSILGNRGSRRGSYLRDDIYPDLILKKLGGSGPVESYEDLMRKADIAVTFGQPTTSRSDEETIMPVRRQGDRLDEVERKLDRVLQSRELSGGDPSRPK